MTLSGFTPRQRTVWVVEKFAQSESCGCKRKEADTGCGQATFDGRRLSARNGAWHGAESRACRMGCSHAMGCRPPEAQHAARTRGTDLFEASRAPRTPDSDFGGRRGAPPVPGTRPRLATVRAVSQWAAAFRRSFSRATSRSGFRPEIGVCGSVCQIASDFVIPS